MSKTKRTRPTWRGPKPWPYKTDMSIRAARQAGIPVIKLKLSKLEAGDLDGMPVFVDDVPPVLPPALRTLLAEKLANCHSWNPDMLEPTPEQVKLIEAAETLHAQANRKSR